MEPDYIRLAALLLAIGVAAGLFGYAWVWVLQKIFEE